MDEQIKRLKVKEQRKGGRQRSRRGAMIVRERLHALLQESFSSLPVCWELLAIYLRQEYESYNKSYVDDLYTNPKDHFRDFFELILQRVKDMDVVNKAEADKATQEKVKRPKRKITSENMNNGTQDSKTQIRRMSSTWERVAGRKEQKVKQNRLEWKRIVFSSFHPFEMVEGDTLARMLACGKFADFTNRHTSNPKFYATYFLLYLLLVLLEILQPKAEVTTPKHNFSSSNMSLSSPTPYTNSSLPQNINLNHWKIMQIVLMVLCGVYTAIYFLNISRLLMRQLFREFMFWYQILQIVLAIIGVGIVISPYTFIFLPLYLKFPLVDALPRIIRKAIPFLFLLFLFLQIYYLQALQKGNDLTFSFSMSNSTYEFTLSAITQSAIVQYCALALQCVFKTIYWPGALCTVRGILNSRKMPEKEADIIMRTAEEQQIFHQLGTDGQKLLRHIIGNDVAEPWKIFENTQQFTIYSRKATTSTNGYTSKVEYKIEFTANEKFEVIAKQLKMTPKNDVWKVAEIERASSHKGSGLTGSGNAASIIIASASKISSTMFSKYSSVKNLFVNDKAEIQYRYRALSTIGPTTDRFLACEDTVQVFEEMGVGMRCCKSTDKALEKVPQSFKEGRLLATIDIGGILFERLASNKTRLVYSFSCTLGGHIPYLVGNMVSLNEVKRWAHAFEEALNNELDGGSSRSRRKTSISTSIPGQKGNDTVKIIPPFFEDVFQEELALNFATLQKCWFVLHQYLLSEYENYLRGMAKYHPENPTQNGTSKVNIQVDQFIEHACLRHGFQVNTAIPEEKRRSSLLRSSRSKGKNSGPRRAMSFTRPQSEGSEKMNRWNAKSFSAGFRSPKIDPCDLHDDIEKNISSRKTDTSPKINAQQIVPVETTDTDNRRHSWTSNARMDEATSSIKFAATGKDGDAPAVDRSLRNSNRSNTSARKSPWNSGRSFRTENSSVHDKGNRRHAILKKYGAERHNRKLLKTKQVVFCKYHPFSVTTLDTVGKALFGETFAMWIFRTFIRNNFAAFLAPCIAQLGGVLVAANMLWWNIHYLDIICILPLGYMFLLTLFLNGRIFSALLSEFLFWYMFLLTFLGHLAVSMLCLQTLSKYITLITLSFASALLCLVNDALPSYINSSASMLFFFIGAIINQILIMYIVVLHLDAKENFKIEIPTLGVNFSLSGGAISSCLNLLLLLGKLIYSNVRSHGRLVILRTKIQCVRMMEDEANFIFLNTAERELLANLGHIGQALVSLVAAWDTDTPWEVHHVSNNSVTKIRVIQWEEPNIVKAISKAIMSFGQGLNDVTDKERILAMKIEFCVNVPLRKAWQAIGIESEKRVVREEQHGVNKNEVSRTCCRIVRMPSISRTTFSDRLVIYEEHIKLLEDDRIAFAACATTEQSIDEIPDEEKAGKIILDLRTGGYLLESVRQDVTLVTYALAYDFGPYVPLELGKFLLDRELNRVYLKWSSNFGLNIKKATVSQRQTRKFSSNRQQRGSSTLKPLGAFKTLGSGRSDSSKVRDVITASNKASARDMQIMMSTTIPKFRGKLEKELDQHGQNRAVIENDDDDDEQWKSEATLPIVESRKFSPDGSFSTRRIMHSINEDLNIK